MAHTDGIKGRLGNMFLKDRGNVDEQTAALVKNDLESVLGQFFLLRYVSVELAPVPDGTVEISVHAVGRRLRREKS